MAPGVVQLRQPHEVEHLQVSPAMSFFLLQHRHRNHTSNGRSANGSGAPASQVEEELLVLGCYFFFSFSIYQ
jgi:hypothetical protein